MKFALLLAAPVIGFDPCETIISEWVGLQADMHDGDQKFLSIKHHTVHVEPSDEREETWLVKALIDSQMCTGSVDFNVPGKEDHPPVPLKATFYALYGQSTLGGVMKMGTEFSDPSGTISAPEYPLNHWVSLDATQRDERISCPTHLQATYADIHDGDKKQIIVKDGKVTITSSDEKQTWVVNAQLDSELCSAVIDFNVPGKPSPAPMNLTATFWIANVLNSPEFAKTVVEFTVTDPETLADDGYPLNHWVELPEGLDPYKPPVAKGKCCYGFPGDNNWKGCQSATACPANPWCETQGLCEGICNGAWCNNGVEELSV